MPTVQELAIQACKRAGLDPTHTLRVQTMVPAALSNLAKAVAKDPVRRNRLITDPTTVSDVPAAEGNGYAVPLATVITEDGVMMDSLRYGTIFYEQSFDFLAAAVNVGFQQIAVSTNFAQDQPITFTTSGSLPGGLVEGTTYYASVDGGGTILVPRDIDGDPIELSSQGTGTHTVSAATNDGYVSQWLGSPNQGNLTSNIPFDYTYIWLIGEQLYTNRSLGTFRFAVPYQPTLDNFPDDAELEDDLLDTLVAIVLGAGIGDTPPEDN